MFDFLRFLFPKVWASSKCSFSTEVRPVKVIPPEKAKEIIRYLPFSWHRSKGRENLLFVASVSPRKYEYNKRCLSYLLERYGSYYNIGLFFSDIPDPEKRERNFCSKAAVFACVSKNIRDFFNIDRFTCDRCSPDEYRKSFKMIEEKEERFYEEVTDANGFPVIVLEDGRIYDLGYYTYLNIEELFQKILGK